VSGLIYVTAPGCHLCEHGREVLDALEVERREISIDSDEAATLAARGIPLSFLPVLTDGVRAIGYGRLSEKRLRKEFAL
jgi:glutaredoxin